MKKGFTLIELLVVVLIIGVLASVALPLYQKAVDKARMAKVLQTAGAFERAIQASFLNPPSSEYYFTGNNHSTGATAYEPDVDAAGNMTVWDGSDVYSIDQDGIAWWVYGQIYEGRLYGFINSRGFDMDSDPDHTDFLLSIQVEPEGRTFQACESRSERGTNVCKSLPGKWRNTDADPDMGDSPYW